MEINFDNSMIIIFAVLCVGGAITAFIYFINQLEETKKELDLMRARNDILECSLAKILHYFDEDDIRSYRHAFEKTNALIDARVALTGKVKSPRVLN